MHDAAKALALPADRVATALNLAEGLRLGHALKWSKTECIPVECRPYATAVMKDPHIHSKMGSTTSLPFNENELLLLLALYLLVHLPSYSAELFTILSQRSERSAKDRLYAMMDKLNKLHIPLQ